MTLLLPHHPVTEGGDRPSRELVEIIQRMSRDMLALRARLDAMAAVTGPSGGATVDDEARTAIGNLIAAAT